MLSFDEVNEKIWDLEAEVFIPCAASRLITKDQIDRMIQTGIEVVAAGANVPFADPEIFFGPIADYSDEKISIIPDFISNCGMARVFAYLMGNDLSEITEVSEKYLLDLERKAFVELCAERKTLERIQSLLQTGKILRN